MEIRYGRKRNGIIKQLKEKLSEWFESIEDKSLREAVKRDTIVTGGSIASMLLGEKVNDYDVYFKTKATTMRVAKYYAKQFFGDDYTEEEDCFVKVKEEVIRNIKGEDEERVVIFIQSSGVAEAKEDKETTEEKKPYRPVFLSQNAITLSDKFQIIIRFYGEPEKIHSNYDFVHAKCYWDNGKGELVLPPESLEALLSRTLIYEGSLYPIASIFRMKKFLDRGWRISAGQQLKIMWQISEIDLKDINVIREQLTGVDMAYMQSLITALEKVSDPEKIDSKYVCKIIDRIFNGEDDEMQPS